MTTTRTESFVPLISALPQPAGERKEFRVTVIPKAKAKSFQSATAATPVAAGSAPHAATCEPKVNLQRDGNRVTGIQIQCSCGQVMELSCVYDVAAAQQP